MDPDLFDEKIRDFFAEDSHCAAIQRKNLILELLITTDHYLEHKGATLVSQKGRAINVHPDTVKHYWELQSLIYDYTKLYGKNQDLEELKNKWTTPARSRYFQ
ncbi:MAG TPA: hypothetical protein VJB13_01735 [Candidatus Nanoarchaeia archaeon]|nr:hypothetical protein [Candidatus Nanoarchaeia archaeon]